LMRQTLPLSPYTTLFRSTLGDIDQNSAKFSLTDRQIPIRVALQENARAKLDTIKNLPVQTQNGGSVQLGTVADIAFGTGPKAMRSEEHTSELQSRRDLVC